MAETAGDLRTALLRRVRDPDGNAFSDTVVYAVLTEAQRLVNAHTKAVLQTTSATRSVDHPLIQLSSLSNVCTVEGVRWEGKNLDRIDWKFMVLEDPEWFRKTAMTPLYWDTIGFDTLLVWPRPLVADTVSIINVKSTATLDDAADVTELPDNHMPAVLALAEQILLFMQRLFVSMKPAAQKLALNLDKGSPT